MMVALGFCHKDYIAAEKMFRWMVELDGQQKNHTLVLVAAAGMDKKQLNLVKSAAESAFHKVFTIMPVKPDERGWPVSSNHLFLTGYKFIQRMGGSPWLWIEADCVPIKPLWLDALWGEYQSFGKPFMGCIYEAPWPHLTGCAIYPAMIENYNPRVLKPDMMAWDMVDTDRTIPHVHHTGQYQHVWGNFKYNIAPTFPSQASMRLLKPEAVLFHRCKDGSLIDRLRERKRFPRICKVLAKIGSSSNGFDEFEDSHCVETTCMAT